MSSYDPKLLEAFYRFMAEASRSQGQAQDFFEALTKAASPEEWAKLMKPFAPSGEEKAEGTPFQQWSEAYWEALGFVPKSRYQELERHYLALREKLEQAERLLKVQGQEEKAKEAVEAWSSALEQTLEAQRKWWGSWLDPAQREDEAEPSARADGSSEG